MNRVYSITSQIFLDPYYPSIFPDSTLPSILYVPSLIVSGLFLYDAEATEENNALGGEVGYWIARSGLFT